MLKHRDESSNFTENHPLNMISANLAVSFSRPFITTSFLLIPYNRSSLRIHYPRSKNQPCVLNPSKISLAHWATVEDQSSVPTFLF